MRPLHRPRTRGDRSELVKGVLVHDVGLGPEAPHGGDATLEARATLLHRTLEGVELLRQKSPAETHIEPTVRDPVQHRGLARDLDRMVEDRQDRAGHEAHALCPRGNRGEEHDRARRHPTVRAEVVLDGPDMAEAQLLRENRKTERLVEVDLGRLLFLAHRREEVDAEGDARDGHRYRPLR